MFSYSLEKTACDTAPEYSSTVKSPDCGVKIVRNPISAASQSLVTVSIKFLNDTCVLTETPVTDGVYAMPSIALSVFAGAIM